jgi:plasmid stabilization system protein ParE
MPRSYRIILLPEAYDDLGEIFDYIKRDSPQNAVTTVDRLVRSAQSLSQFPHRYKVHRWRRRPSEIIHSMPVPPFIVFYCVIEKISTVRVLTIRHGARQPPKRFA